MDDPTQVEVRPEPPEEEREAILAALEQTDPAPDAWTRAALAEATSRDPGS